MADPANNGRSSTGVCQNEPDEVCCRAKEEVLAETRDTLAPGGTPSGRRLLSLYRDSESRAETLRHVLSTLPGLQDLVHGDVVDLHLQHVDLIRGIGNATLVPRVPGRRLVSNAAHASHDACYGDISAGCCGSVKCVRLEEVNAEDTIIKKRVVAIGGIYYTEFEIDLVQMAALFNLVDGRKEDLLQIALLLKLQTMSELSVSLQHVETLLEHTHIGCNPLDGYIAWRQSLGCPSCERPATITFLVKGNKCLKDICRPIAMRNDESGIFEIIKPKVEGNGSCCLVSIHTPGESGQQRCHIAEICEESCSDDPPPGPEESPPPTTDACCPLWKLEYYPVKNSHDSLIVEMGNQGTVDLTNDLIQELYHPANKPITFGPLRSVASGGTNLVRFEEQVAQAIAQRNITLDRSEWSLGVKLSSHLCLPRDLDGTDAFFAIQASGDVDVNVDNVVTKKTFELPYLNGCSTAKGRCRRPNIEVFPIELTEGCSFVEIRFVDVGMEYKWLRVDLRKKSLDCTGEPRYPVCAEGVIGSRHLLNHRAYAHLSRQEPDQRPDDLEGAEEDDMFLGSGEESVLDDLELDSNAGSSRTLARWRSSGSGSRGGSSREGGEGSEGREGQEREERERNCNKNQSSNDISKEPSTGPDPEPSPEPSSTPVTYAPVKTHYRDRKTDYRGREKVARCQKRDRKHIGCEASESDEGDFEDDIDLDLEHDKSCSLFRNNVCMKTADDVCPEPQDPTCPKPCLHHWLVEVYQFTDPDYATRKYQAECVPRSITPAWLEENNYTALHTTTTPHLHYPVSGSPPFEQFPDDYLVKYSAFVCYERNVFFKAKICSNDHSMLFIDDEMIVLKPRQQGRDGRCWQMRTARMFAAGCHRMEVLQAHAGSLHGITLQLKLTHTRKCATHQYRQIPARHVVNPLGCDCDDLPPDEPPDSMVPPAPPPLPNVPGCPNEKFRSKGWEFCVWKPASIPQVASDSANLRSITAFQWNLPNNPAWRQSNCQMVPQLAFKSRSHTESLAPCNGLAPFKQGYLTRARTKIKVTKTTRFRLAVYSGGGFQLNVYKINTIKGRASSAMAPENVEILYSHTELKHTADSERGTCFHKATSSVVELSPDDEYMFDLLAWENEGSKCLKVLVKMAGSCQWMYLAGHWHPSFLPECLEEPEPEPECPNSLAQQINDYMCPKWHVMVWLERGQFPSIEAVLNDAGDLTQLAPHFEAAVPALEWHGRTSSETAEYWAPIRDQPGWKCVRKDFVVAASAHICMPTRTQNPLDVIQFKLEAAGRNIIYINGERHMRGEDTWRGDQDFKRTYYTAITACTSCFNIKVLYFGKSIRSQLRVRHRLGTLVSRGGKYRADWTTGNQWEVTQDGGGSPDKIKLVHPVTKACPPEPVVCNGPCCGTCSPDTADLIDAGLRLFVTRFAVEHGYAFLQLRISRSGIQGENWLKWGQLRHAQIVLADDAIDDLMPVSKHLSGRGVIAPKPSNWCWKQGGDCETCSPVTGHRGPLMDLNTLEIDRSRTITLKRVLTDGDTAMHGLEYLCKQNVLSQQQDLNNQNEGGSCAVFFTFKDGSCLWALAAAKSKKQQTLPSPPSVPEPSRCRCNGNCVPSNVCDPSSALATLSRAAAVMSKPKAQCGGLRIMYLRFTVRDLSFDTAGVVKVTIFLKHNVVSMISGSRKRCIKPSIAECGCASDHRANAITFTGQQTPSRGRAMTYRIAIPNLADIDLSKVCNQVHPQMPQKSCLIVIETSLGPSAKCHSFFVLYQKTCSHGTCIGSSARRLRAMTYGEIAANYHPPSNWIPINEMTQAAVSSDDDVVHLGTAGQPAGLLSHASRIRTDRKGRRHGRGHRAEDVESPDQMPLIFISNNMTAPLRDAQQFDNTQTVKELLPLVTKSRLNLR